MSDLPPTPAVPSVADYQRLCGLADALLVILTADGIVEHATHSWESTLGWSAEELVGRSVLELLHPGDVAEARAVLAGGATVQGLENRYRTREGGWRRLGWRAECLDGRWYCVAEDITRRRELERDALHDPLTGVLNRAAFFDRLAHALARAERDGRPVAVLFLDLDGFKGVNDTRGHAVGDAVLRIVAERLDGAVRRADSLGRLGGDEFVVLVEDVTDAATVDLLVDRVTAALREPLRVAEGRLQVSASIGVVLAHGGPAAEVLGEADVAMYRAKARGRDRAVWFDEDLRAEVRGRLGLAADLRGALQRDELRLHYQPQVGMADESIVGCEALLRWEHPERGLLGPDAFLTIAEEDGDILEIGAWVLGQACRQQRRWREEGHDLAVSVNVSARELSDPRYPERVGRILRRTRVEPVSIVLEVTEAALVGGTTEAQDVLGALRALGVRIALDDFGRGQSSLEHVKTLPVDVLKIDRSFVRDVGTSEADRAIIAAVVTLASTTGLTAVAEGVETDEQRRELLELRCPFAQGHWFGRPTPPDQLVLDGYLPRGRPGVGDPFVIREFMRQIGVPARIR